MNKTNLLLKEYHEAVEEIRHRRGIMMNGIYIGSAAGGVVLSIILQIIYDNDFNPTCLFFKLALFIAIVGVIALIGGQFSFSSQDDAKKIATKRAKEIEEKLKEEIKDMGEEVRLITKIEGRKDSMSDFVTWTPMAGLVFWIIFWAFALCTIYSAGFVFWIIYGIFVSYSILWDICIVCNICNKV